MPYDWTTPYLGPPLVVVDPAPDGPRYPGGGRAACAVRGELEAPTPVCHRQPGLGHPPDGPDAALLLAYIEASPSVMLTFLIVDIDHPTRCCGRCRRTGTIRCRT